MVMKNIPMDEVFALSDLVDVAPGQVVSRTVMQNSAVSITLFAFDKGEEISTHESRGDAFVTVLEGTGRFTVGGVPHVLKKGDSIVMPANIPHAIYGEKKVKWMLVVCFPQE